MGAMTTSKANEKDWFWEIVESSQRNLVTLSRKLESLSKDELVRYQVQCWHAKEDVNPYSQTYDLEASGLTCSEDDADDFAAWVVGEGRTFCEKVRDNPDNIRKFFDTYEEADGSSWDETVDDPEYHGNQRLDFLANAVYSKKFDEDFAEAVDAALDEE